MFSYFRAKKFASSIFVRIVNVGEKEILSYSVILGKKRWRYLIQGLHGLLTLVYHYPCQISLRHFFMCIISDHYTAQNVSVFENFLVRIFPHSDWIQKDSPYFCIFSPHVGKYRPEELRVRTLSTQCYLPV